MIEIEVEEKNEKGRVIGTTYKQVQEEGPRKVATISNGNDAQEFEAVKRGLVRLRQEMAHRKQELCLRSRTALAEPHSTAWQQ